MTVLKKSITADIYTAVRRADLGKLKNQNQGGPAVLFELDDKKMSLAEAYGGPTSS